MSDLALCLSQSRTNDDSGDGAMTNAKILTIMIEDVSSLMAITRKRIARLHSESRNQRLLELHDHLTCQLFQWKSLTEAQMDGVVEVSRALDALEREEPYDATSKGIASCKATHQNSNTYTTTTQHHATGPIISQLEVRNQGLEDKIQTIEQERKSMVKRFESSRSHSVLQSMANVKTLRKKLQKSIASLDTFKHEASTMHQEVQKLRDETHQQREMLAKLTTLNNVLESQVETLLYEQCLLKRELEDERSLTCSSVSSIEDLVIPSDVPFHLVPREPIAVLVRDGDNRMNHIVDSDHKLAKSLMVTHMAMTMRGSNDTTKTLWEIKDKGKTMLNDLAFS